MNEFLNVSKKYRTDIDGLRSIAVLAVIFFHFGFLPYGYLGVDIFFVISGFLITNIIYTEIQQDRFSIQNFYMRRIRRILPLSLFIVSVALIVGYFTMLPDDLENLAQSVVATNFSANNILQAITTKNYWDVVNDYKPLMHTWSLGIEEQYYFLYPLLFILLGQKYIKFILPIITLLTIFSLFFYFMPHLEGYQKFYFLPFRFFELSVGGIIAILSKNHLYKSIWISLPLVLLIALIGGAGYYVPKSILVPITVVLSALVLLSYNEKNYINKNILQNRGFIFLGKISFGLYLWHQMLLAFSKYIFVQNLETKHLVLIFALTIGFSTLSYYLIEQPFRNKNKVNARLLLTLISVVFALTTIFSLLIYFKAGVVRDVPALDVYTETAKRNMHAVYNDRIYKLQNKLFETNKIKVLVVGNSFARDFANVLKESSVKDSIEISYVYHFKEEHKNIAKRADVILFSTATPGYVQNTGVDINKVWVIGTKNFGINNGVFYNYKGGRYLSQRTLMEAGYLEKNNALKAVWNNRYIDYISPVLDTNNTMPIFTSTGKFISQDCRHLTKAGAQFYAKIFDEQLKGIFINEKI